MKKDVILFVVLFLIASSGLTQTIENLDYISDFNDGLAAIKKDNQWGFINKEGNIVINFRNDLVTTNCDGSEYPIFKDGRCLILQKKDGVSYFGFIDATGKTVIEPQFLNAANFINNEAIVLKLVKEKIGENDILDKNIVNYKYYEVTIDINGEIKNYLTPKGFHVVLDRQHLLKPPKITSKRISDNVYAILNENNKWAIIKTTNGESSLK
jgi:hypothetical protein